MKMLTLKSPFALRIATQNTSSKLWLHHQKMNLKYFKRLPGNRLGKSLLECLIALSVKEKVSVGETRKLGHLIIGNTVVIRNTEELGLDGQLGHYSTYK